jgi:hypothetical protein
MVLPEYQETNAALINFVLRFQVLTAASMKLTAFWDATPRSLVKVDRSVSLFDFRLCVHWMFKVSQRTQYSYEPRISRQRLSCTVLVSASTNM